MRVLLGTPSSVDDGAPDGRTFPDPESVAMLAHELRRRLAALRVVTDAIEILQRNGDDAGRMVAVLSAEVEQLQQLTHDVLEQHGRGGAEPAQVDVVTAVETAAETVRRAHGCELHIVHPKGRVPVEADETRLRQALENVLENAVLHGGDSPVEVVVRRLPGDVVEVLVQNGSATPQRRPGQSSGHGIGLFLVRRFVADAGGRLRTEERPDGGVVVGLRLPCAASRPAKRLAQPV